jgi:subfamily B ATP-binding cassette protein MsbA
MNRVLRKTDLASPISEVMGTSLMAVVIWFGGNEVLRSEHFGAEQFIAYILFFYQMITPAKTLSRANSFLQRGRAAGQRIFEVLDTPKPHHGGTGHQEDRECGISSSLRCRRLQLRG